MTDKNSEIFNFSDYKKVNGVRYFSNLNGEFEKLYIETREKEGRVLSDEEIKQLPITKPSFELHKEWELRKQTSDRFISYLEKKSFNTILDIGCGNGWFTNLMAQVSSESHVIGLDVNRLELEQGARVFHCSNLDFVYANVFDEIEGFIDSFDLITLNASVQYFPNFEELMNRLYTFLKPNGEIHILDSPFYKKSELTNAQERTRLYFKDLGNEKLSNFYFHHSFDKLSKAQILYKPIKGIKKRILPQKSPFLWLKFVQNSSDNSVKIGFSKIAEEYEDLEKNSSLIQYKRKKIRNYLHSRLNENNHILELNCGTGLDAIYFAKKGFFLTATDISEGMLSVFKNKIKNSELEERVTIKNNSFLELDSFSEHTFDCVFSNFGGLNCVDSEQIKKVIEDSARVLKPEGIITLVIMPKVTFYEWLKIFKGNLSAFRRFKKGGIVANVEGENVMTFYHSAKQVKTLLEKDFVDIEIQNIFTVGPGGNSYNFPKNHPVLFNFMVKIDSFCFKTGFLKGFGDYYIISGSKKTKEND